MLPSFVIGLREGLETVVILGAIAVFLRARGRTELLGRVWRASAVAAVICGALAFVIRFAEVSLPWRRQEQFETVVGVAALLMVTYMVVWMRRFPKDLQRDSSSAAASALARDSGRALVVLAFFAVLREGFEIAVFVVATIGMSGSSAWLSTAGALLGIAVALIVGIGVVRGSTHLDVPRFFRVSAFVLVLTAAGIAMTTANTANAAGWITFGQTPQFNLSWLAPPGSVLSSFTTGMLGIQPYPVLTEVVAWLAYFVPMALVVLWPRRRPHWSLPGRRATAVAGGAVGALAMVAVGGAFAAHALASPVSPRHTATAKRRVLFATLSDVTCQSARQCVAVGDFLPYDKDAAQGDPDGDGQATHTLAESYNGKGWKILPSPDKGNGGADLSGVSCPERNHCFAVGYYRPDRYGAQAAGAPPSYPLVESYDGRSWRIVTGPPAPLDSILTSVSCPSVSSCLAVGYTTTAGAGRSSESFFAERFDGVSWAVLPVSPPPGTSSGLNSVACTSASDCVAVGNVAPGEDPTSTHPLIEVYENGTWRTASLPGPADGPGILYDVTCTSVGRCTAVGTSQALRSTGSALVVSSAGSTWTADTPALEAKGDTSLTAVGCDAPTDCYAAGTSWVTLAGGPQNIVAGLPGWRLLISPSRADDIDSVSCPTPDRCVAVGSRRQNDFGNTDTLVADFSEGTWDLQPTPVP